MLKDKLAVTKTRTSMSDDWRENMENTFLPLVKEELHDEFLNIWGDWFVLQDVVEQTKKPGLLKSKNCIVLCRFIVFI